MLAGWTAGPTLTGPPVVELDTELVVVKSSTKLFLKNSEMLKFTLRFMCLTEIMSLKVPQNTKYINIIFFFFLIPAVLQHPQHPHFPRLCKTLHFFGLSLILCLSTQTSRPFNIFWRVQSDCGVHHWAIVMSSTYFQWSISS